MKQRGGDQTIRLRIMALIESPTQRLTGRQIAAKTRLDYKQVIDALNALLDQGKISRIGRKHTALWAAPERPSRHPLDDITLAHLRKAVP